MVDIWRIRSSDSADILKTNSRAVSKALESRLDQKAVKVVQKIFIFLFCIIAELEI